MIKLLGIEINLFLTCNLDHSSSIIWSLFHQNNVGNNTIKLNGTSCYGFPKNSVRCNYPNLPEYPPLNPDCASLFWRCASLLLPRNDDQRPNVLGQVLLQDRREHNVHVRRGPGAEGRRNAEVSAKRQMVEHHPHLRPSRRGWEIIPLMFNSVSGLLLRKGNLFLFLASAEKQRGDDWCSDSLENWNVDCRFVSLSRW